MAAVAAAQKEVIEVCAGVEVSVVVAAEKEEKDARAVGAKKGSPQTSWLGLLHV